MDSKASDGHQGAENSSPDSVARADTVSLTEINAKDATFRITTRKQFEDLLDTIQSLGLLHPPVLIENSSGYSIVCGFRRIAACRQLGWKSINARIHKAGADRFEIARLAIADNALQRPLNLVETSRALNLLADTSPDQQQFKEAALSLRLPISPSVVPKALEICRLPLPIQEGILSGTINMSMALELGEFDAAVASTLVGFFSQLKVGLNKQRELLLLLTEIARREDISVQQLIADKPLQDILQNTVIDRAIQRQNIRSYLRQRRYPAISKAEADYQKRVRQLKLGKQIQLVPPKNFEGTTYALTLHFENRQDLSNLNKRIEKILEHPALGKILKR